MVEPQDETNVLPSTESKAMPPPSDPIPVALPENIQDGGRLLLIAAALGIGFDALCGEQLNGIGFPLFITVLLSGWFLVGLREGVKFHWRNMALLATPLVFFAVMVAVHANPFLTFWNTFGSIVLLLLLLHYSITGSVSKISFGSFLVVPWKVFGNSVVQASPVVRDVAESLRGNAEDHRRWLPLLRGLLLALPILGLFLCLLASADELFSHLLVQVGNWFLPKDLGEQIAHILISVTAGWLIAGGITYAINRRMTEIAPLDQPDVPDGWRPRIGYTETMMVLGSVLLVFVAFIAVQSTYFFGGIDYARSLGLNYASYARRGFWELVSVAVLTLTLVHSFRTIGQRDSATQNRVFNGLGTLLVGCTLVLLASAMQRMHAYEAAWGATPLRLYVDGFILWLGIALCWFVATLWRWNHHFAAGVLACGLGYLITLNLVNPDASVARRNMAQYQRTGNLCIETVNKLSDDAVPALSAAYQRMPEGTLRHQLGVYLRERWEDVSHVPHRQTSLNLSREQARKALTPLAQQLPSGNL